MQLLAEEVVQALRDNSDKRWGRHYQSITWDDEFPAGFRNVVVKGDPKLFDENSPEARAGLRIRDGAIVEEQCSVSEHVEDDPGTDGWPCNNGGAVFIQVPVPVGPAINCIIGYSSDGKLYTVSEKAILSSFQSSLNRVSLNIPRLSKAGSTEMIDLTALAAAFASRVAGTKIGKPAFFGYSILKGVAFIPIYGIESRADWEIKDHLGRSAPDGGLIENVLDIVMYQGEMDLRILVVATHLPPR